MAVNFTGSLAPTTGQAIWRLTTHPARAFGFGMALYGAEELYLELKGLIELPDLAGRRSRSGRHFIPAPGEFIR